MQEQIDYTFWDMDVSPLVMRKLTLDPKLPFRRFYMGFFIVSLPVGEAPFYQAEVDFMGGHLPFRLTFMWKAGLGTPPPSVVPLWTGNVIHPAPPFSVEVVPSGTEPYFLSAAPAQRDEMVVCGSYSADGMLIRMLPIPIYTGDATEMKATIRACYTTNAPGQANLLVHSIGLRSSAFNLT